VCILVRSSTHNYGRNASRSYGQVPTARAQPPSTAGDTSEKVPGLIGFPSQSRNHSSLTTLASDGLKYFRAGSPFSVTKASPATASAGIKVIASDRFAATVLGVPQGWRVIALATPLSIMTMN
jgi:hypothetical protein